MCYSVCRGNRQHEILFPACTWQDPWPRAHTRRLRRYLRHFRTGNYDASIFLNPGLLGMPPNGSKIRRGEAPQVGVACENPLLDRKQPISLSKYDKPRDWPLHRRAGTPFIELFLASAVD